MQTMDDWQVEAVRHRESFHDRMHRKGLDNNKKEVPSTLWSHFRNHVQLSTSRFLGTADPMPVFEIELHEAWDYFIEAAKVTSRREAAADQLVLHVIMTRELGHLKRLYPPAYRNILYRGRDQIVDQPARVEHATTSSGERMWIDLPYFASDLQAFWLKSITTMNPVERENVAGIYGRLSGSGICDPHITVCAIILFREALETPRPMSLSGTDSETPQTTVAEYLPAVLAWLLNGTYQILALCVKEHVPVDPSGTAVDWTLCGELLHEHAAGFSMSRWRFWKERLMSIQNHADIDEHIGDQAKRCLTVMSNWEGRTGSKGDAEENERTQRAHFLGQL